MIKFKIYYQLLGVFIVLLASYWTLDFSLFGINFPWVIKGDMVDVYAFAQNIQQFGQLTIKPNLGWPYQSDVGNWGLPSLFDFTYFFIITKILTPIAATNLLIFFGFILVQITTFEMFQKLKFSLVQTLFLSISLTLLPWHFQRSLWHVTLANYFTIPLAIILIILLKEIWNKYNKNKLYLIIISLILISTTHTYNWFYTEILLLLTLVFLSLQNKFDANKLKYFLLLLVMPISILSQKLIISLNNLYTVMTSPVERSYEFIERYSGSFIALFMPSPMSGFEFFSKFRSNFDQVSKLSIGESGPWNSIIGIVAIAFVILFLFTKLIGKNLLNNTSAEITVLVNLFLFLFTVTLFFYWTTGFGALFSFFITDWIRSWGRLFIYLVYFAVIILALFIKQVLPRLKIKYELRNVLLGLIALVIFFDQTIKQLPNDYANTKKTFIEISNFSNQLDKKLEPNCPVLQLPILRYPEGGMVGNVSDYDPFWLYLTNPNRPFSYAAVKGTQQANWQEKIDTKSISKIASQAASVGYCAVALDLRAYADVAETGNKWIEVAGQPLAVSKNTRLAVFKIDPKLKTNSSIQSLITLTWKGQADTGTIQGSKQIDFYDNSFELFALNPTKENVNGKIKFGLRGGNCTPSQSVEIFNSSGEKIYEDPINRVTKQIELDLKLKPREQTLFKFKLTSNKCTVEWFSNALVSVRNERFLIN